LYVASLFEHWSLAAVLPEPIKERPADVSVAVTGVAGPEPDEDGNPVGLVCIAVSLDGREP
jgi:nicotinamide mononucleotide (NMN) deamidase PncC